MDAVSVALVVTVLSIGSALVYLFKADFESRQPAAPSKQTPTGAARRSQVSRSQPASSGARVQSSKLGSKQQQVPLHETPNGVPHSKQLVGDSTAKQRPNGTTGHKQTNLLNNAVEPATSSHTSKRREFEQATQNYAEPQTTDPSIDELDSALVSSNGSFNGSSMVAPPTNKQLHNTGASPKTSQERRHSSAAKKRHSLLVDPLLASNGLAASKDTYSSEKLFNLMAASNLSKEEIELAIETLLNKLETGSHHSDWKPAKSDPLHKLRNQLRDNEAALIGALQNQELYQKQCGKLRVELKEEKSRASATRDELDRCRKELGVLRVALEQVRANTSRQQLAHDEKSKSLASLERAQLDLKDALAEGRLKESELRDELEERKAQIQKLEVSEQGANEKVRELEAKLRSLELQIEQIHSNKNQTDYESSEKISELESEQVRLAKALKDQSARLAECMALNAHLQKSSGELEALNGHLEELLKRQKDEKVVSESMLRGNISELEQELKDLSGKLAAQRGELEANSDSLQVMQEELSASKAREIKLAGELDELRSELSQVLSDVPGFVDSRAGSWPRKCLESIEHLKESLASQREQNAKLSKLVEELTEEKSALLFDMKTLPSTRSNSPSNGSKVSSKERDKSEDRKLIDKKNLELESMQQELAKKEEHSADLSWELSRCQLQIKDLKLEKSKLEAQIKFGLDSLKMEQERARKLEEELEECGIQVKQNA